MKFHRVPGETSHGKRKFCMGSTPYFDPFSLMSLGNSTLMRIASIGRTDKGASPGCLSLCGGDPPGKATKSQVYL